MRLPLRGKLFKYVILLFVVFNLACVSLAAMPPWVGNRVVDAIMDWGDKHIHGPFKKGGGDEKATRQVLSDILMPVKAWRAVLDITGGESQTATAEQDNPGYSQSQGVPLPPQGAPKQTPNTQPPAKQTPTIQPAIPISPEIHQRDRDALFSDWHGGSQFPDRSSHVADSESSGTSKTIELRAGEHSFADATQPAHVDLNPEHATGSSAPAAEAAKPQPASSPAPEKGGDRGRGDGPMHGAERVDHGGNPSEKSVADHGKIA
jgi:hypothetical protein